MENVGKPKFAYVFCDMDGTLLNSRSAVSHTNAVALKEAIRRGIRPVIATGKGLLVYGSEGEEISRVNLEIEFCKTVFRYSKDKGVPLVAFSGNRCLTLFEHPLVDTLHSVYHEPKAEIIPSVDLLVSAGDIQKLIFLDTAQGVSSMLRPYWSEASKDQATVVQALPDMLEIVPKGTSKGEGVRLLLDQLRVPPEEVMAIGDGENDVEMLKLVGLGVALSNACIQAKQAADVIGHSNDDHGVAKAIYKYAF